MLSAAHAPSRRLWLFSPKADLLFVLAPFFTGYAFLYAHYSLGVASLTLYWFWSVTANGPHLFATLTRTLFNAADRRQYRKFILISFSLFFVGPAALLISHWTHQIAIYEAYWVFQLVWAYYHVSRQHYGFLSLYQKRFGAISPTQKRMDWGLVHLSFAIIFAIWYCEAKAPTYTALRSSLTYAFIFMGISFAANEIFKHLRGIQISWTQIVYFVGAISLPALIVFRPTGQPLGDMYLLNVVVTYPHNIQYLAIVWFYHQGKPISPYKNQFAKYLSFGLIAGALFFYSLWFLSGRTVPFSLGTWAEANSRIAGVRLGDLFALFLQGIIFQHYYLDQKIWKLRHQPGIADALKIAA